MRKLTFLAWILVCAGTAFAQSPTAVVVTDANGKALTVTGTASATQVGSPVPVVITDANGKVIALGAGAGITFVAANPATCTPGTTGVVELNVAPYTVSYCSATNTWTAIGSGGGGTPCVTTALSAQFNNGGAFGCFPDFSFSTPHTMLVGASGVLDLTNASLLPPTAWFSVNGVAHTSLAGVNFLTSTVNSCGHIDTPSNPATNQSKHEITGTLNATCGGTGLSNPTAHSFFVGEGASVFNLVTSPAVNGDYACIFHVTGSAAVDPTCPQVGVLPRVVSGATATDTPTFVDATCTPIVHDIAGSAALTVTVPTPTTLTNSNACLIFENHSANIDTLKATTWTIQLGTSAAVAGATGVTVPPGRRILLLTDPFNATNWIATCVSACGGGVGYGAGAGSVNVMTVTTIPAVTTNAAGTIVEVLPNLANTTTTPTLAVGGQTAMTIVKGPANGALIASDYNTTQTAIFLSNGSQWQLLNPQAGGVFATSLTTGTTPPVAPTGGTGGGRGCVEGTALTGGGVTGGNDWVYCNSTTHALDAINGATDEGPILTASRNLIFNFNQAAQSQVVVSATEYYITRSDLDMPAVYRQAIAAGTTMHWRIAINKTAAGTGIFQILLKKGTNGSTADTSIVTQTIGTQTAAVDNMEVDISLTWTSATAAYWTMVPRQSAASGAGFGLVFPAAAAQFTGTISAQTTTTASDKYGVSVIFTTGTPTFVVNEVAANAYGVL